MAKKTKLPAWATLEGENRYGCPVVGVDGKKMYEALLAEYEELYSGGGPAPVGSKDIVADSPTQYALEVCYQSMKMDLWAALGTMNIEIRVHDAGKQYAQKNHPEGRGAHRASRGLEARRHYRALRGELPDPMLG